MRNADKTKEKLTKELEALHSRVVVLEKLEAERKQVEDELTKHREHPKDLGKQRTAELGKTNEIISQQSQEILHISTPVMEVHPGVLVAHLNGKRRNQSMQQLMELLLERIVETSSSVVLLDLTGRPTIDTEMAQDLIKIISAVRRLDTHVVLAGLHASISRPLAHLGVDISGIKTCSSLAAGLWVALDILELEAVNKTSSS